MAQVAFVLIEASVGKSRQVAQELRGSLGVNAVHVVTGPYSLVAIIEGADIREIGEIVTSRIHNVAGVDRTLTLLALD